MLIIGIAGFTVAFVILIYALLDAAKRGDEKYEQHTGSKIGDKSVKDEQD